MSCKAACGCLLRAHFYNSENGQLAIMVKQGEQKENQILFLGPQKIKTVIENLERIIPNLDTAVLQIFDCQFPDFSNNGQIREAFRDKLSSMNLPYCFITDEQAIITTMLIGAKVDVSYGENVIAMYLHDQKLDVYEYEFTKNGYKKFRFDVMLLDTKSKIHAVRGRINISNPKYVLLSTSNQLNPLLNGLKKVLQEPRLYAFNFDLKDQRDLMMVEYSKWLLDKTSIKYYVLPTPIKGYKLMNTACEELITVDVEEDVLPLTKSCIIPKSVDLLLSLEINNTGKAENFLIKKMEQKCHRNKLTFSMDSNYFVERDIEQIILPQIESFCSNLNKNIQTKNPVIGLCDNFSVICIYKDNEKYQFVDDWNGIYGNELVISFCKEKPIFGEEALKKPQTNFSNFAYSFPGCSDIVICLDQKKPILGKSKENPYSHPDPYFNPSEFMEPGYVVYDIIKIMSMPPEAIEIDDRWGFKITKDEDNPVVLEFRNHINEIKLATPAFLFALLLKEHIKVIKTEIGEKPGQLDFCILDEKYCIKEKERIKKGLEEACELLKIKCGFIDL